jgi:phosphopantothenate synthetase
VDPKPYLASTSWEDIERINAALSKAGGYEPGRGECYDAAHALWEKTHNLPLTFMQAADLCLECHRLAPFSYFNGNTFASCARVALAPAVDTLDTKHQTFARAALAHYIAGTIDRSELIAIVPVVLGE